MGDTPHSDHVTGFTTFPRPEPRRITRLSVLRHHDKNTGQTDRKFNTMRIKDRIYVRQSKINGTHIFSALALRGCLNSRSRLQSQM